MRPVPKLLLLALPLLAACSNWLDLGGNDDRDPGPPPPAASPAQTSSALSDYCASRTSLESNGCVQNTCSAAQSKACVETFDVYRDEYLVAMTKCGFACGSTEAIRARDTCVADATDQIAPTQLQVALANDICAVCPRVGSGACLDNFFLHGRRLPSGAVTVGGPGSSYDMYSEATVEKLQARCVDVAKAAATKSCWPAFYACIDAEIAKLRPASVTSACAADVPTITPSPADGGV